MTLADRSPTPESEDAADRHAHRFGASPPLSLGVEEELLLVDDRKSLRAASELVLDSVSGPAAERISSEIFADQIELKTGVCLSSDEALAQLREARAANRGLVLLRRTPEGRRYVALSGEGWEALRAARGGA